MDDNRPYERYNKNWLLAKESLRRKQQIKQSQMRAVPGSSYYGGVPFWMNHRHRKTDQLQANQFLIVHKLDTQYEDKPPQDSKPKKAANRIEAKRTAIRRHLQSQPEITVTKSFIIKSKVSSVNSLNAKPAMVTRQVIPAKKVAPPVQVSRPSSIQKKERRKTPEDPDVYLPAPRIIYETYGPSN